jgi:hypothetical protein
MALHLVKLCVGCESVEDELDWIRETLKERKRRGLPPEHAHTTRMIPKRAAELLDGGSLYWVIKGNVQLRQRLLAIRPFRDKDGIERCDLVLDPKAVLTQWQPRRAFQGWRYLSAEDAPGDLATGGKSLALPPALRLELAELGLL